MSIKETLSKAITSTPDIIQFSKDRKFEEAWIISKNDSRPTPVEINTYLTKEVYSLLTVEYVWNSAVDSERFVLTVFYDSTCKLKDANEFVEINLNIFYDYSDFTSLIDTINQKVIGSNYLLNTPIEAITLGIFNHWFSTTPIDLWKTGERYGLGKMVKQVGKRPNIFTTDLNYQALFFRFNLSGKFPGPYYGIKTPCCKKIDSIWKVDFDLVDYWINKLLVTPT